MYPFEIEAAQALGLFAGDAPLHPQEAAMFGGRGQDSLRQDHGIDVQHSGHHARGHIRIGNAEGIRARTESTATLLASVLPMRSRMVAARDLDFELLFLLLLRGLPQVVVLEDLKLHQAQYDQRRPAESNARQYSTRLVSPDSCMAGTARLLFDVHRKSAALAIEIHNHARGRMTNFWVRAISSRRSGLSSRASSISSADFSACRRFAVPAADFRSDSRQFARRRSEATRRSVAVLRWLRRESCASRRQSLRVGLTNDASVVDVLNEEIDILVRERAQPELTVPAHGHTDADGRSSFRSDDTVEYSCERCHVFPLTSSLTQLPFPPREASRFSTADYRESPLHRA